MQNIEKIYEIYAKQVYKYLFCLTHDKSLSEELTQETFYIAVKQINHFRGECKIFVWLCQIAKNLWYKELQKRKNKQFISLEEMEESIDIEENTEEKIIQKIEKAQIYQKINKLNEITKQVLYLRLNGDFSFKEIGEFMNKSENWARTTFYRGKQKIKEEMRNEEK